VEEDLYPEREAEYPPFVGDSSPDIIIVYWVLCGEESVG